MLLESFSGKYLHGNHLHVSSFQPPVQLPLIGFDHAYIVGIEAKLAAMRVFPQAGRVDCMDAGLLLRVGQGEAFSPKTHFELPQEGVQLEKRGGKVWVGGQLG